MLRLRFMAAFVATAAFLTNGSIAQEPIPYGAPITLEQARKAIAAAQAEAAKQKWAMAVTIVDSGGHLVAFEKMDNTQLGSIDVSIDKAKCALLFRRSTKMFEESLAKGGENLRALRAPGVIPIEGGVPIVQDGKIIGAVGVSGARPVDDGQVAKAAIDALQARN
jgi:uncharacterized protein GlcG (DUF336 family)